MKNEGPGLSWRSVGILGAAAALILSGSLFVALRAPDAAPARGPHADLVLNGKLTKRIPWAKLPVSVTWDGTKAGAIPKDLRAVYKGQSLYRLIGLVDDKDPKTFNMALANKGYKIRLIAKDGYTWDLKSKSIIGKKNWIVARLKNGKALSAAEGPYRDVGPFIKPLFGRMSVKLLVRIQLVY